MNLLLLRGLTLCVCALTAITTTSCVLLASRDVRIDPRGDFPGARPFENASDTLPGEVPVAASDVRGAWYARERVEDAQPEIGRREPWLFYTFWLWIREDDTYELIYQVYWGSRIQTDPQRSGVDVRESGRFSLAGGMISFEPEVTRAVELRDGTRQRRTLSNEHRTYLARVDGGYLNLAGRCATYQVEPICRESREVWISLRSVPNNQSPEDVPEL